MIIHFYVFNAVSNGKLLMTCIKSAILFEKEKKDELYADADRSLWPSHV